MKPQVVVPAPQKSTALMLILALALAGGGAGYAFGMTLDPVYEAKVGILVGEPFSNPNLSLDSLEASEVLATIYADVAERRPVLEGTVQKLKLDIPWQSLAGRVAARVAGNQGAFITVEVEAPTRAEALAIADELTNQLLVMSPTGTEVKDVEGRRAFIQSRLHKLRKQIDQRESAISKLRNAGGLPTNALDQQIAHQEAVILELEKSYISLLGFLDQGIPNRLQVLEEPHGLKDPVRPGVLRDAGIGAAVGLLLGIAIAYLRGRQRIILVQSTEPDAAPMKAAMAGDRTRDGSSGW